MHLIDEKLDHSIDQNGYVLMRSAELVPYHS